MFKGGMGGFGNMQQLMRQAQTMQKQMQEQSEKAELELANSLLTAKVGGGMVEVEMTGKRELTKLTINPQIVDVDDVEMLQDLVIAGVNEVLAKVEELEAKVKPNIPGIM